MGDAFVNWSEQRGHFLAWSGPWLQSHLLAILPPALQNKTKIYSKFSNVWLTQEINYKKPEAVVGKSIIHILVVSKNTCVVHGHL